MIIVAAGDSQNRLLDVLVPRIEAAREWAGLTWAELAELTGIAESVLHRWLAREYPPSLLQLCACACACDVSLAFFLVDVDEAKERIAWAQASTP